MTWFAIEGGGNARAFALLVLAACRGSASAERDGSPAAGAARASTTPDVPDAMAATASPDAAPAVPVGDWERVTEPYKGMVIRIVASGDVLEGTVLTPSRLSTTPQLACQASLWRRGEPYLKLQEDKGSIVVRDWGLTAGVCRHADTKAKVEARLESGELVLAVTRGGASGGPTAQRWRRAP